MQKASLGSRVFCIAWSSIGKIQGKRAIRSKNVDMSNGKRERNQMAEYPKVPTEIVLRVG